MPRIVQLPPTVITKIAAGEVIERPASVVKELLENAVDAGATRVEIDLDAGGTELIRVVDNGHGIAPDDLPLAFASHATSKLRNADDLFHIGTLGFRGEALASIGGVAQVELQSRPPDSADGAALSCHGGELSAVRPWNGSGGTRIEVRHLFYNVPVRRKFLRTVSTELGHIVETVTRLCLAYPTLHVVLRHNGKMVHEVPATATLFDRLGLFFGRDIQNALYQIEPTPGPAQLTGYVADPSVERGNAKLQYLFVNGRWVRDRSLAHAVQEGYRGLLMTGRYPVWFLFLDLPPDAVDVNVHPTKSEVRFRDSQAVFHLVLAIVRERLRRANLTPRMMPPREDSVISDRWPVIGEDRKTGEPSAATFPLPMPPQIGPTVAPPITGSSPITDHRSPITDHPVFTDHRVLQLHDAYLVVETPEGMLVIDQHALHERILFEQLRRRIRSGALERQRLLIPEPIDLPGEQAGRVLECRDALAELGLEVEDFGGGTVLLTAYPALLGRVPPTEIFRGVADVLAAKDRPPTRDALFEHVLATMACRAAVKAGDRLTPEEIASLIAQRALADDTHHCPHGRPTSLLFSRKELDRQFRRI
ncbi:MAG: DNA mismatch repair endonuclease MutL [Gemmataceae bacterium]